MKRTVPDCRAYGGTCGCSNADAVTCPHPDDIAAPVASAAPSGDLPPLPERDADWAGDDWFTADSMKTYALACIAASGPNVALVEALKLAEKHLDWSLPGEEYRVVSGKIRAALATIPVLEEPK